MTTNGSPHPTDASTLPPRAAIVQMAMGFLVSQALIVAAELGLADLVGRAPQTAPELAATTGTHEHALYRLLRYLASHGVFAEDSDRRFHLTPLAAVLQSDAPDSVRALLQVYADPIHWNIAGHLLSTIRTGETAFDHLYGMPFFAYLAQHTESRARFQAGMANFSGPDAADIVRAYDFSPFQLVVDIGGGQGGFLAAVLSAYPAVRGVLYDQPQVVAHPA
ncbi:MAG: acetylserotonin O-methyltransferase, partial [Candidatus Tectomicrobia bacterium]|nr:acetylserotonin O-methyltransferase [Candidatus Tectomicrobia bacterium]